jgi:hypothetical protein
MALSSAQVDMSLADSRSRRQYRTFHLLSKPDILTCYQHDVSQSIDYKKVDG